MISFEQFSALYLLILVPLLGIFLLWRGIVRASVIQQMGDKELIQTLTARISPFRRQLKALLWLASLTMLILALEHKSISVQICPLRLLGDDVGDRAC